jgi:hypothetical protein
MKRRMPAKGAFSDQLFVANCGTNAGKNPSIALTLIPNKKIPSACWVSDQDTGSGRILEVSLDFAIL